MKHNTNSSTEKAFQQVKAAGFDLFSAKLPSPCFPPVYALLLLRPKLLLTTRLQL